MFILVNVYFGKRLYAIIKITIRVSPVPLHEFAAKQLKKGLKVEVKKFCEN